MEFFCINYVESNLKFDSSSSKFPEKEILKFSKIINLAHNEQTNSLKLEPSLCIQYSGNLAPILYKNVEKNELYPYMLQSPYVLTQFNELMGIQDAPKYKMRADSSHVFIRFLGHY